MNEQILKDIEKYEGFESEPYHCPAGYLTIGLGTNLERGISKQQAYALAKIDLLDIKLELEDKIDFFHNLNEVRKGVLIQMAYNMGVPRLLKFKKTLEYINQGKYEKASKEMLDSKWHRDFIKYAPNTDVELLRSSYLSRLMLVGEY